MCLQCIVHIPTLPQPHTDTHTLYNVIYHVSPIVTSILLIRKVKDKLSSGSRVTATGSKKCKSHEQEDSFSSLPLLALQRKYFDQTLIVLHHKNTLNTESVECDFF